MGTSTGGMDIPPLILNKYFKIPVSVSLNAFDICILLGQAILIPPEMLLYGVILVITYTTVLNKVLLLGGSKMEVKIISRNPEPIRQAIIGHLDRGTYNSACRGWIFTGRPPGASRCCVKP